MEKDIKIIEELIKKYELIDYRFENMLEVEETTALEHLIKAYRELEKENKRLKKLVPAGFCPDINTDYLKKIEQSIKRWNKI